MNVEEEARRRRSIRLRSHDYSLPASYFVTICTRDRLLFFADTAIRRIAEASWTASPDHFPGVAVDEWVIMPNHLHGILVLGEDNSWTGGGGRRGVQLNASTTTRDPHSPYSTLSPGRRTLSVVMRTYKAAVTSLCRRAGVHFAWQRNFYEHIVRDDADLDRIQQYIRDNPTHWESDENNPAVRAHGYRTAYRPEDE